MAEMKVYQREHFQRKIRDLLEPEIEKEEMLLSSTIADMTESAEKNLAKKIGADVIITDLEEAEQELEKAEKLAEKEAEKLPIGKRISYLKAVKTNANDSVMEAHVGSDLKDLLGDILKPLGLSWQRPLPAIAPPSEDRPED
jgi:membrane-associated HD superfamily phosphohydrolase